MLKVALAALLMLMASTARAILPCDYYLVRGEKATTIRVEPAGTDLRYLAPIIDQAAVTCEVEKLAGVASVSTEGRWIVVRPSTGIDIAPLNQEVIALIAHQILSGAPERRLIGQYDTSHGKLTVILPNATELIDETWTTPSEFTPVWRTVGPVNKTQITDVFQLKGVHSVGHELDKLTISFTPGDMHVLEAAFRILTRG